MAGPMVTVSFGPFDALAVLGAFTGIAALVWQIFTWRRLGHRVRVSAGYSIMIYGDVPGDDDQVCISARNEGTSAVTVTNWGIRVANGEHAQKVRPFPGSDTTPHRLEPGSEANFYFPVGELRDYNGRTGFPYSRMKPYVKLATRQTVFSNMGVPLRN